MSAMERPPLNILRGVVNSLIYAPEARCVFAALGGGGGGGGGGVGVGLRARVWWCGHACLAVGAACS